MIYLTSSKRYRFFVHRASDSQCSTEDKMLYHSTYDEATPGLKVRQIAYRRRMEAWEKKHKYVYVRSTNNQCECRWCDLKETHRVLVARCFGYPECCIKAWLDGTIDEGSKSEWKKTRNIHEIDAGYGLKDFCACMKCKMKLRRIMRDENCT